VDAIDLQSGDWLKTSAGTWAQVADVEVKRERAAVHNLTVDRDHTYYVGAGNASVLVHNDSLSCDETDDSGWPVPNMDNCEECAKRIQGMIGGDMQKMTDSLGAPRLGPSTNDPHGAFRFHFVVVKDGRAFDGFTGPGGLPMDEYRAQWLYGDDIDFSPIG
jgi:hypothetical protein